MTKMMRKSKKAICLVIVVGLPLLIGLVILLLQKPLGLDSLLYKHTGVLILVLFISLILIMFYLCMFVVIHHFEYTKLIMQIAKEHIGGLLKGLLLFSVAINTLLFILSTILLIGIENYAVNFTFGLDCWLFLTGTNLPNAIIMLYVCLEIIFNHDEKHDSILDRKVL